MNKLKVVSLFGGIGADRKAFELLKKPFEIIDYIEIDKKIVQVYNSLFNCNHNPADIKNYNLPDLPIDFVIAGSPCQDISNAGINKGNKEGSNTRSSLMWEIIRLIKTAPQKPKILIWENVKNALGKKHLKNFEEFVITLTNLGYHCQWKILNGIDHGIPQKRKRIFLVASYQKIINNIFKFKKISIQPLSNFINSKLKHEKYYLNYKYLKTALNKNSFKMVGNTIGLSDLKWHKEGYVKIPFYTFNQENYVFNPKKANLPTITATGANSRLKISTTFFNPSLLTILVTNKQYHIRKITEKEAFTLMGFPKKNFEKIKHFSETLLRKVIGNSIIVNVLKNLIKNIIKENNDYDYK